MCGALLHRSLSARVAGRGGPFQQRRSTGHSGADPGAFGSAPAKSGRAGTLTHRGSARPPRQELAMYCGFVVVFQPCASQSSEACTRRLGHPPTKKLNVNDLQTDCEDPRLRRSHPLQCSLYRKRPDLSVRGSIDHSIGFSFNLAVGFCSGHAVDATTDLSLARSSDG